MTTGAVIFTYDFLIVHKRDHATGLVSQVYACISKVKKIWTEKRNTRNRLQTFDLILRHMNETELTNVYEAFALTFSVAAVRGFVKHSMSSTLVPMHNILGKNSKNSNNEYGSVVERHRVPTNVHSPTR